MESFNKYNEMTLIELNKELNDLKSNHEEIKLNILSGLDQIKLIEENINENVDKLRENEDQYIIIIDEINSR